MKFTIAQSAIFSSIIAMKRPQCVSGARNLAQFSRGLNKDTCAQLIDNEGSGHLLSLQLTRGGNDSENVQSTAKTYHEHGTFAATAEWYSDVCGDYSLSCTHHECLLGLYFVPCKDDDYETTDGGDGNTFSVNGFTSLQLQGTTELAFQGATSTLLQCVSNCGGDGSSGASMNMVQLDAETFEVEMFDGETVQLADHKGSKSPKGK